MSEEQKKNTAWDPETMGYGKHEYRHVDPSTVNPDDYAVGLRGEEQHYGDVREYNSAANSKHPENDASLDWLSRCGTEFETEAEGFQGKVWKVTNLPRVLAPEVFIRATAEGEEEEKEIPATELGITVGRDNLFKQVKTRILKRGIIDKSTRERLTKLN